MLETPVSSNSATLLLFAVSWNQTVFTNRAFNMRIEAEASKRGVGRFSVPGLGNILELPFELSLLRGTADGNLPELPTGAVGFLTCHENRVDNLGMQQSLIGGAISLPEAVFDDIWERVRLSPDFHSTILIKAGPVRAHGAEDTIWDRAKDKVLFVTEADFTFKRDERESAARR